MNKEFKLLGVEYTETTEFEKQANKLWPETHAVGLDRIRRTIRMFKREHKKQTNKAVAHIIVSHGWFVDQFVRY